MSHSIGPDRLRVPSDGAILDTEVSYRSFSSVGGTPNGGKISAPPIIAGPIFDVEL